MVWQMKVQSLKIGKCHVAAFTFSIVKLLYNVRIMKAHVFSQTNCEHILHCGATQFLMIWPSMCFLLRIFKWVLSWNFQLQISHSSFGSECINSCFFIEPFCVNACKHDLHLYSFSPLCTFLCDFNWFSPLNMNALSHRSLITFELLYIGVQSFVSM